MRRDREQVPRARAQNHNELGFSPSLDRKRDTAGTGGRERGREEAEEGYVVERRCSSSSALSQQSGADDFEAGKINLRLYFSAVASAAAAAAGDFLNAIRKNETYRRLIFRRRQADRPPSADRGSEGGVGELVSPLLPQHLWSRGKSVV